MLWIPLSKPSGRGCTDSIFGLRNAPLARKTHSLGELICCAAIESIAKAFGPEHGSWLQDSVPDFRNEEKLARCFGMDLRAR